MDRRKVDPHRSLLSDGKSVPFGVVAASANRHDSSYLGPALEKLSRVGFHLPPRITVLLDTRNVSSKTRYLHEVIGSDWVVSASGDPLKTASGDPLKTGRSWVAERTNPWHVRSFKELFICSECTTKVIKAMIGLTNCSIVLRRLIHEAWHTLRWAVMPKHKPLLTNPYWRSS